MDRYLPLHYFVSAALQPFYGKRKPAKVSRAFVKAVWRYGKPVNPPRGK